MWKNSFLREENKNLFVSVTADFSDYTERFNVFIYVNSSYLKFKWMSFSPPLTLTKQGDTDIEETWI